MAPSSAGVLYLVLAESLAARASAEVPLVGRLDLHGFYVERDREARLHAFVETQPAIHGTHGTKKEQDTVFSAQGS